MDKHLERVAASVGGIETSKLLWVMLITCEHMHNDSLFWKASFYGRIRPRKENLVLKFSFILCAA